MATAVNTHVLRIVALLRQATSLLWKSLPPERRNAEKLQTEALRLQMHMLQNFTDDLAAFTQIESAASGTPPDAANAAIRKRVSHDPKTVGLGSRRRVAGTL
ncbi:MAG: hypothetical protein DLM50_07400 [Candidatus Meridianibacter frigidus]|nr:MAG: hypothetical protein DLM50_07400 [Candidatus Eremiobacteraeota bacterium]